MFSVSVLFTSEIERLAAWSSGNNLALNTLENNGAGGVLTENTTEPVPLITGRIRVEWVDKIKFLGTRWTSNTTAIVQKAQK